MVFNKPPKKRIPRFLGIIFLCSFIFCLWLNNVNITTRYPITEKIANAQSLNIKKMVDKGVEYYQKGDFKTAIEIWEKALKENIQPVNQVIIGENLARTYQQIGKSDKSIHYWNQIIAYYIQTNNSKMEGRAKAEQAQVYNNIGQLETALALLCNPDKEKNNICSEKSAVQIVRKSKDVEGEITALGILGDTYRLKGNYELALETLGYSLKRANKLKNPNYIASINLSLGNTYYSKASLNYSRVELAKEGTDDSTAEDEFSKKAQQEDKEAIKYLKSSLELTTNNKDYQREIQILQTLIPIYYRSGDITSATKDLEKAISLLEKLPNNQTKVYATINLARFLKSTTKDEKLGKKFECVQSQKLPQAEELLNQAIEIAQKIGNLRAESFAKGELGNIYECRKEYSQALKITQQARFAAEQHLKAPDSLYLWEWQTGRILKKQHKIKEAILAYDKSLNTLDSIRKDILTTSRDTQFDFRDTIEPIYRDLVKMRLGLETPLQASNKSLVSKKNDINNNNFRSLLKTVDNFQLAQLQNYFGNDCDINDFLRDDNDEVIDKKTAIIRTVIFDKKTAIILRLPNQDDNYSNKYKYQWYKILKEDLTKEVNIFRNRVHNLSENYEENTGRKMYKWMIAPFTYELEDAGIKQVIFIHDGILRSIPMAPLYDGEKYLVEKYAIATTPSLRLINKKPLKREKYSVLALGLSTKAKVNNKDYDELEKVDNEIKEVINKIEGKALINKDFTKKNLQEQLGENVYSIIHFATHGNFGTVPENTFIITGEKNKKNENEIIKFNELDKFIRSYSRNTEPLEILTLTACESALGNKRSALGLAGVAVQAGAKTAMASLWVIDDKSTSLFAADFYDKLISNPNMSKAEVLREVQINFLENKDDQNYQHPYYWSPFILIGNWL
jgi:CHAT domain-containing protein